MAETTRRGAKAVGRPKKVHRRSFGKIIERENSRGEVVAYIASFPVTNDMRAAFRELEDQTRIYKSFRPGFKHEADAWLNENRTALLLGSWKPPHGEEARRARSAMTFHDYASAFIENHRKKNNKPIGETTKDKYRQYLADWLDPVLGDMTMGELDGNTKAVQRWYESHHIGKNHEGESMRHHVYVLLKMILEEASGKPVDDEGNTLIQHNPLTFRVPKPKVLRAADYVVATREQVLALADAIAPRFRLAVLIAGTIGAREGEILALRLKDFERVGERTVIHIRHSVKVEQGVPVIGATKTESSERDWTLPDALVEQVTEHCATYGVRKPNDLLFSTVKGRGVVRPQNLRNAFQNAKRKLGDETLAKMVFHDLRRTAGTLLLEEGGATTPQAMAMLGHNTLGAAQVYQRHSKQSEIRLAQKINESMERARHGAPQADHKPKVQNKASETTKPADMSASATSEPPTALADMSGAQLAERLLLMPEELWPAMLDAIPEEQREATLLALAGR